MPTQTPPFRLSRLRIKNFRSIGEADVALGPLTVLVGPNGSGKSNVVDALRFLRDCFTKGLDQAVLDRKGIAAIRRWSAGGKTLDISLGITMGTSDQESISYDFTLASNLRQGFTVKQETLHIQPATAEPVTIISNAQEQSVSWQQQQYRLKKADIGKPNEATLWQGPAGLLGLFFLLTHENTLDPSLPVAGTVVLDYQPMAYGMRQFLRSALLYTLQPTQLRLPQRQMQSLPFEESGENLAAVLRYMHRQKPTAHNVRATLSRLVAGIVDFSVRTTGSYLVTYLHYQDKSGKIRKADLGQESDGTLRVLGMLAALYQPVQHILHREDMAQLVVIEEPEMNIHPGMLAVLAEEFQEASLRSQLLLTTHSPDLLDFLPVESFLVVEKVDGETVLGPLAADQQEIVRQRLFGAGELLRTEGLHRETSPPTTVPQPE